MTNEMTAEEAIKWLKDIERSFSETYFGEWREALKMAIQALDAQPCEDCISREAMLSLQTEYAEKMGSTTFWKLRDDIRALPSVTPKYTDEEIDKAQAIEQAYVDKMVELAVEEAKRPKGKWIETPVENDIVPVVFKCSECGMRVVNPYKYCPNCGAEMGGAE